MKTVACRTLESMAIELEWIAELNPGLRVVFVYAEPSYNKQASPLADTALKYQPS